MGDLLTLTCPLSCKHPLKKCGADPTHNHSPVGATPQPYLPHSYPAVMSARFSVMEAVLLLGRQLLINWE